MLTVVSLILATLIAEDAACVAAGLLVQRGELDAATAVGACAAGIFVGDIGLWALGRFGRRVVYSWPWLARQIPDGGDGRARSWIQARPAAIILGSRLVPGTRLPLYVGAGLVGLSGRTFAFWSAVAVAVWAPVPVLGSALIGEAASHAPGVGRLPAWAPSAIAAVLLLVVLRALAHRTAGPSATLARVRTGAARRLTIWFARHRRWEFWPPWLFYAPVAGWVALLAIRYRGLSPIAAANPGIPDGGVVGESKFDILAGLPADSIIPSMRIGLEPAQTRQAHAVRALETAGWPFPVVMKPDVGQRGAGVRLAHSHSDVADYLQRVPAPVLIQPYHPGPYEAGIFYRRLPGETRGRVLAITDKHFPYVIGDGRSTIAELVHAHPRYRLQADLFLNGPGVDVGHVVPAGERVTLSHIGNHARGAVFLDGTHLWTPALEARVDEIARQCPGFFIGRFDVRYRDQREFKAGRDLAIVELNGVTGEPTNVYDPRGSLLDAYRGLFRQWSLVFAIGHANRRAGTRPGSTVRLLGLARTHLTARPAWHGLD